MSFPAEIHLKYIPGKRLKKHRISGVRWVGGEYHGWVGGGAQSEAQ